MPINVKTNLPAKFLLEKENIFTMDEKRATTQDIRPLKILIFNLMPTKEETELQLLRMLSNTPLQIDITFAHMESHTSKNISQSHLDEHYTTFSKIRNNKYDGMIITGAPVEQLNFNEVSYWKELCEVMEWSKTNVFSTLHICWGAQAGLYYHYDIDKILLTEKLSGIYLHKVLEKNIPLTRGMDDIFYAPHSRYTGIDENKLLKNENLKTICFSEKAGSYIILGKNGKQLFITGHSEYDLLTLEKEYKRDLEKGINPKLPENYYPENNPNLLPSLLWRANANCIFSNWLNYYVYQDTPYNLENLK